jgi:hypothetical protein
MSTLAFVCAICPPLMDAPAVAAMLAAGDYTTVTQLAVLRGGRPAERHEELELLGISSHFNRRSLLLAIDKLPPPPVQ